MYLNIDLIQPSPNPIRKTWDEEKMNELAQSIKEQGLIVPVKVRPTSNSHYEIVYGHRRIEAMRRIPMDKIPKEWVIIEGIDDIPAHRQALTENKVREDMLPYDVALAFQWEMEQTGESQSQIGKRYGITGQNVGQYLALLNIPVEEDVNRFTSIKHLMEAKAGAGEDKTIIPDILRKAAHEDLSSRQTRKVAESVANTQDPVMRQKLIDAPYSPYTHDPEYAKERADRYGAHDPMAREKTPAMDEAWRLTLEVSMMLNFIKKSREMYDEAVKMDEIGKFAPEARPFIARKLRQLVNDYERLIERLEN